MTLLLALLLACGDTVLPVEDAATAPMLRKRTVTLTGGTVRADLGGTWSRSCTPLGRMPGKGTTPCQELFFGVAPLVGTSWKPGDAIPAWVTCGSDVKNEADCTAHLSSQKGDLTGLVVTLFEADSESGWMKAIASSKARHGLVSANKAPVMFVAKVN